MTWLAALALNSLKGVGNLFAWLFADARRWMTVLIVLLGLAVLHEHSGKMQCHRNFTDYKAQVARASKENAAAQKKANDEQKGKFDTSAEKANVSYPAKVVVNHSAADRYKRAHRVRPIAPDLGAGTTAPESDVAGVSREPATDADVVTIAGTDIDTCTVDYTYARQLYEWGQDLVAKGAAEYGPENADTAPK